HASLIADLHPQRVEINNRIAALQRPILPLHHRLQHRIGHRADEVRAHLHLIVVEQKARDLAHRHAPRIHRDNLLIEAFKALPALWRSIGDRNSRCDPGEPRSPSLRFPQPPSSCCSHCDGCRPLRAPRLWRSQDDGLTPPPAPSRQLVSLAARSARFLQAPLLDLSHASPKARRSNRRTSYPSSLWSFSSISRL